MAHVALLELKRPGEVPRPLQEARLQQWRLLGVDADWVDSKAGVDRWLAERIERWNG